MPEGLESVCASDVCGKVARMKEEPVWDNEAYGVSDARAELYADHVVKEELVLGPELLQKPSVVYTPQVSAKTPQKAACVEPKLEGGRDDANCELKEEPGSMVLKEELELGPVVLQPPDAVYSLRGQARLLTAKKTQSAKTNKPKAAVEEKKAQPSKKIAKRNSAAKIQEPSASSQDDLPWNIDMQDVSPEKPAVTSSSTKINILTAETNFKCEKCGKAFNIKPDLEKHINTHMLMKASTNHKTSKVFMCKICNCIFNTKLLVQEHEKSRHGVKYFACDECGFISRHAHSLQIHLRTHTGDKPFKCSQCSSAFPESSKLRIHLRTHTGEKPFKCSQCISAFTTSNDLQRHIRTHTGEKPFKCSQCSSAFTTSNYLKTHLRTHTGEKPFDCNICDYKTTQPGNLKRHLMSRHSGEKPFGCDECSYRGATRRNLTRHMKSHRKPT